MSLSVGAITFDCESPQTLAAFWSAALDIEPDAGANEFFTSLGRSRGWRHGIVLFFLKVPEHKSVKNRVHLDLRAADREAEVARLEALGARSLTEHNEWGFTWTVMTDPEGNEFCIGPLGPDDQPTGP